MSEQQKPAPLFARGLRRMGQLSHDLDQEQDICGPRTNYRNKDFFEWSERAADLEDEIERLKAGIPKLPPDALINVDVISCEGCPHGTLVEPIDEVINDLAEAHYRCSVVDKTVWGENPECGATWADKIRRPCS